MLLAICKVDTVSMKANNKAHERCYKNCKKSLIHKLSYIAIITYVVKRIYVYPMLSWQKIFLF